MIKTRRTTPAPTGCTPRTSATSCPPSHSSPADGSRSPTIRSATAPGRREPVGLDRLLRGLPQGRLRLARRAPRAGLRQRQPRLRAAPDARADRARTDRGRCSQLDAQTSWQAEVGTRGRWGERLSWDFSVYDIELSDEIQNVNVQPFPGAPFAMSRFQSSTARTTPTSAARRSAARQGRRGPPRARPPEQHPAGAHGLHMVALRLRRRSGIQQQRPPQHTRAPRRRRAALSHNSGLSITPGVEIVPRGYYVDSTNATRTPSYALVNVKMGFSTAHGTRASSSKERNLTDESFVSALAVAIPTGTAAIPATARLLRLGRMEIKVVRGRLLPILAVLAWPPRPRGRLDLGPGSRQARQPGTRVHLSGAAVRRGRTASRS